MRWNPAFFRGRPAAPADANAPKLRARPAASICVASGKGGTGKSIVSASLASLLAEHGRTLLADTDLGVGNGHILLDATPARSFVDVIQGHCAVREAVHACGDGLDLLGGGSGVSRMASLSPYELHLLASGMEQAEQEYDYLVVDSAAGISDQTVAFAAAADLVVLVTTPDLTAMTDAYALLKVLHMRGSAGPVWMLVNRCQPDLASDIAESIDSGCAGSFDARVLLSEPEQVAQRVAERICGVSRKFLGSEPHFLGCVPEDRAVGRSIALRTPVVRGDRQAPAALALRAHAQALLAELERLSPRGWGANLRRRVAFSAATA